MPIFESPNICRDLPMTPEYRTLAAQVRDNLGHKMVEVKESFPRTEEDSDRVPGITGIYGHAQAFLS